ncbi:MAG: hypothetical protein H0U45_16860 [Tatlockia sp.]|nr:hypothetical protein [Tatlockia sp.]
MGLERIARALFPASLYKNRACSLWAGKESRLSLTGRACTYINLGVQLDLGVLAGVVMYGLSP